MRIMLYDLDNCREVVFADSCINVLEIENPKYLSEILFAFKHYSEDNNVALFDKDKKLNTEKEIRLITDFIDEIDVSKTIMSKLEDKLIQQDDLKYKFVANRITQDLHMLIKDIIKDVDVEFAWNDEIELKDYLRALGFKIMQSSDILDKCLNFIALCARMKLYKVLIFYNVKSVINELQVVELYKQSLYHDQPILLIENVHKESVLQYETKVYVDNDLFDIKIAK